MRSPTLVLCAVVALAAVCHAAPPTVDEAEFVNAIVNLGDSTKNYNAFFNAIAQFFIRLGRRIAMLGRIIAGVGDGLQGVGVWMSQNQYSSAIPDIRKALRATANEIEEFSPSLPEQYRISAEIISAFFKKYAEDPELMDEEVLSELSKRLQDTSLLIRELVPPEYLEDYDESTYEDDDFFARIFQSLAVHL